MNLRTFATVSAVAMFVLGGCIITTTSGQGGGGNGGSGNTGNEGGAGVGGSKTTSSSSGTAGGGGAAACATCGEFVSDGTVALCTNGDPMMNPTASEKLYGALAECTCGTDMAGTGAKCFDPCKATACTGMTPDKACQDCLNTPNTGCQAELGACVSDVPGM